MGSSGCFPDPICQVWSKWVDWRDIVAWYQREKNFPEEQKWSGLLIFFLFLFRPLFSSDVFHSLLLELPIQSLFTKGLSQTAIPSYTLSRPSKWYQPLSTPVGHFQPRQLLSLEVETESTSKTSSMKESSELVTGGVRHWPTNQTQVLRLYSVGITVRVQFTLIILGIRPLTVTSHDQAPGFNEGLKEVIELCLTSRLLAYQRHRLEK